MIRNILAAALGNLARNRLYAAISIGGLAVAFAAAILIAIFVANEFSYDRWIPGAKDVYEVSDKFTLLEAPPTLSDTTSPDVAGWLKLDFPQIAAVARLVADQRVVRHGQVEAVESLLWADPDVFTVLPLPVLAGDLNTALAAPDSVVITHAMARKYFGTDRPVGQTLLVDGRFPLRVTAVLADLPSNTHLRMTIVASGKAPFSELARLDAMPSDRPLKPWAAHTYFRLRPGASAAPIVRRMPAFIDTHMPFFRTEKGGEPSLPIVPIAAIHFSPSGSDAMAPRGDLSATCSVAAVGVLIVLMATINFINLMTARASRRAVEVGIRKLTGADRPALIAQFIGEAMIHVALAALIALAAAELLMPGLNATLGRTMAFSYGPLALALAASVIVVGALAGAYPALVLSGFRPTSVLKGGAIQAVGATTLRQGLVALQFAVLISLIVTTLVVWRQTVFATKESLRLNTDQMLVVFASCAKDALRAQIAALPGVAGAACSLGAPLNNAYAADTRLPDGRSPTVWANSVGFGFFELYGLRPLAGRFFSDAHGADLSSGTPGQTEAVVINRTGARTLGFVRPADAVGNIFSFSRLKTMDGVVLPFHPALIIGVVEDFPMGSIRTRIEPTAFYVQPDQQALISVKLRGRDIPETMTALTALWRKQGFVGPPRGGFLDRLVQGRYREVTQQAQFFGVFAGVALFIACLGLFGLAAFAAERRTKEIGIRKAMGASAFDVLNLLLRQFAAPVLLANLVAWPLTFVLMTRWLNGFAYRIDLTPWPFVLAAAAALLIAALTVSAHALRVAAAKPVGALRYE